MARWGVSLIGLANAMRLLGQVQDGVGKVSDTEYVIQIGGGPENVHYHLYVETGTTRTPSQPYIGPAILAGQRHWPRIFAQNLLKYDYEEAFERALAGLAMFVHAKMRAMVPVDTGALRESIVLFLKPSDGRRKEIKVDSLL